MREGEGRVGGGNEKSFPEKGERVGGRKKSCRYETVMRVGDSRKAAAAAVAAYGKEEEGRMGTRLVPKFCKKKTHKKRGRYLCTSSCSPKVTKLLSRN